MYDVTLADAIQAFSGGELTVTGPTATAGIFSTFPADYLSVWGGVVDQVRSSRGEYSTRLEKQPGNVAFVESSNTFLILRLNAFT